MVRAAGRPGAGFVGLLERLRGPGGRGRPARLHILGGILRLAIVCDVLFSGVVGC